MVDPVELWATRKGHPERSGRNSRVLRRPTRPPGIIFLLFNPMASTVAITNTNRRAASSRHSLRRLLACSQLPVRIHAGMLRLRPRSNNSRDVRHGSASNHLPQHDHDPSTTNGSGRRRQRFGTGLDTLVGQISTPFQRDWPSPERNCSSVGSVGGVASLRTGASAARRAAAGRHGSPRADEPDPESCAAFPGGAGLPRSSGHPESAADGRG